MRGSCPHSCWPCQGSFRHIRARSDLVEKDHPGFIMKLALRRRPRLMEYSEHSSYQHWRFISKILKREGTLNWARLIVRFGIKSLYWHGLRPYQATLSLVRDQALTDINLSNSLGWLFHKEQSLIMIKTCSRAATSSTKEAEQICWRRNPRSSRTTMRMCGPWPKWGRAEPNCWRGWSD